MIEIDGSYGEGGGQILRTALSLSCLFNRPFRIFNIRKGRKKPGLMPQHLTAVRAAQLLSGAEVTGDNTGSTELIFSPKQIKGGDFFFDIGTAGSTSLVLQTLIPSLIFLKEKTTLTLKGGTHVPFSPSFDYLERVFVTFLKKIGINVTLSIDSYGFYPKGGGKVKAEVLPSEEIKSADILTRGNLLRLEGKSGVGNLPISIAERQKRGMLEAITKELKDIKCPIEIELLEVLTAGQGTFIFLSSESENIIAGFTSIGERGKRAEIVGEEAAKEFIGYYSTDAALDPHLADQIVLYLSLTQNSSVFTTSRITSHLLTNLWVIGLFHKFNYSIEGDTGKRGMVRINAS